MELKDKVYNKQCFSGSSLREALNSQYFALSSNDVRAIPFLGEMEKNHRKCPYWMLLKHYCPCQVDWRLHGNQRKKFPRLSQSDLLKDHCSVENVHKFVRACMKRLIPKSFWGQQSNFNCFLDHVKKLIDVQRKGKISLCYMMKGIKVNKMVWLYDCDHEKKLDMLMTCIDFLITKFVCPLIKSFFSVIETTFAKNKMIFFRKRVWHRLSHKAICDFMKRCNLKRIPEKEFNSLLNEEKAIGYSKLHFHLKKTSLRSICNLSVRRLGRASVNDHLKSLHLVLEFEKNRQSCAFGASVEGKEDIHQRLKNCILKIRGGKYSNVFFLTADIQNCFDCLDPHLLFKLTSQVMKDTSYKVFKFRKNLYNNNCVTYQYFWSVHDIEYVRKIKMGDIEVIGEYEVLKTNLLSKLKCILYYNTLKVGKHFYIQNKGISQGSILSSLLCGIFFGFVEKQIGVPWTDDDLLLRQTDDYLLVSPSKGKVIDFFEGLISKLNEFQCSINFSKCCANFDYLHPALGRVRRTNDGSICFSGVAISIDSHEIRSDFSHYEGLEAKDVITMKLGQNPGTYVKHCVLQSLYPKCDSVLFDTEVNTIYVIQSNTLCIFCLCALKLHAFIMWLPKGQRVNKNPHFFLDIVLSLPSALRNKVTCKLKNNALTEKKKNCQFPLPPEVVSSLCNAAFLYKMNQHKSIYKEMINEIEKIQCKKPQCESNIVRDCFLRICLK